MANKIDKLTPEQEAQIAVYRAKGLEIGLNTEPTDRVKLSMLSKNSMRSLISLFQMSSSSSVHLLKHKLLPMNSL